MLNQEINEKFAIVVVSCDKYSDLWPPFFDLFFKNWEDCPFKLYLLSNNLTYSHPKVFPLMSGDDTTWSMNIKKVIPHIKEDYIFMLLEDHFITGKIKNKEILPLIIKMHKEGYNYLRFTPNPKSDFWLVDDHGKINKDSVYRTSTPFSIWRKSVLLSLLNDKETAWDFEILGSERSSKYDNFFLVNYDFNSVHGVKRGKWYRNAVFRLKKIGVSIDLNNRQIMSKKEYIKNRFIDIFHLIAMKFFPNTLLKKILKYRNTYYN